MPANDHPLNEVFGYPIDNFSPAARRHRKNRLCPFNNRVPNCTKDKANDPLGVCSIHDGDQLAVVCPIRFRQDWLVTDDAARFFFSEDTNWTTLTEVRLKDRDGNSAGNIDIVLVAYDDRGRLLDFGSLEIQAVYISGNIRRPFEYYMEDPQNRHDMDWASRSRHYPRADYLSSSRKRLVPQLIYKGSILKSWQKKQAVAVHSGFFETLPDLDSVDEADADIAWLVYDLLLEEDSSQYQLALIDTVYTQFQPALERITTPVPGPIESFMDTLQEKLDEQLESDEHNPPDAPTLDELL